jgi:hypothetical protein
MGMDTLYIDIDLNLTKAQIESLIAEEIQNTTADKHYVVDVSVKYQLQNYPEKYGYAYQEDLMRYILKNNTSLNSISKNTTYRQVLNRGVTIINEQTSEKGFSYEKNFTTFDSITYFTDLTILSESAKTKFVLDEEAQGVNDYLIVFFHDIDNIDLLISEANDNDNNNNNNQGTDTNPITSYQPNEVVKAEDTGAFTSYYIYIIGGLFLLIGVGLFSKIIFKKNSLN